MSIMSESLFVCLFVFRFFYFPLVGSWISFVFSGHPSPPTSSLYVGFIVVGVLQVIITFNAFCNSPGFKVLILSFMVIFLCVVPLVLNYYSSSFFWFFDFTCT